MAGGQGQWRSGPDRSGQGGARQHSGAEDRPGGAHPGAGRGAVAMTAAVDPVREPPRRTPGERVFDVAIWGGLALLLIVGVRSAEIGKIGDLFAGGENMRQLGIEFVRPNFAHYQLYIADMWL